jgi:exopolyphosphatase / guanosine-5'-triphosphate,3'-diphosphate pyrophosphatase
MRFAVIDLGTNTFHLLIKENQEVLFNTSIAAKIGMGGIGIKQILPDAFDRALGVFEVFTKTLSEFNVDLTNVHAFGTSAIRNADNQTEFVNFIKEKTGISISVIDGLEEANLIYFGVKNAVNISENSLIVDIGGGSVEFIICNTEKILWKHSFEIGGLRLMEKFMKKDPLPPTEIQKMDTYFQTELLPLANAIYQYHPKIMVGTSGSFDTLNDLYFNKTTGNFPPENQAGFEYPLSEFWIAFESLVFANREQRMALKGMIPLRVDMIVVAVCLIKYLIQTFGIEQIKISNYALKEGAAYKIQSENAY